MNQEKMMRLLCLFFTGDKSHEGTSEEIGMTYDGEGLLQLQLGNE